jgi:putative sterol carrier protein
MAIEVFSEAWARQWCQELNNRPSYQEAAAAWEGSVALVMTRDSSGKSPAKAVFLDLWHGRCRSAHLATEADLAAARYVLSGHMSGWRDVLSGKLAPLTAVMTGKIRLTRGSMGSLVPFAAAARELVNSAVEMDVSFPEGW